MPVLTSEPSEVETVTPTVLTAWLKDPLQPDANLALSCVGPVDWTRKRPQAVLDILDRPDPVVQTGVRKYRTAPIVVTPMTQDERDAVDALLDGPSRVLLLQAPSPEVGWRGTHAYVVVTGDDTDTGIAQAALGPRDVGFAVTEVRAP